MFVIMALLVVDKRIGRRPMLLYSACIMTFAQCMIAVTFMLKDTWRLPAMAVVGQCIFMAGYSLGFGSVGWVVVSEIFPLEVRGLAVGIAIFLNRTTAGLIAMFFMNDIFSWGGSFFIFAGFGVLSIVFVFYLVPETKGKSLEEIETALPTLKTKCNTICGGSSKREYQHAVDARLGLPVLVSDRSSLLPKAGSSVGASTGTFLG